ncbi:hypothetical protein SMACR_04985 [Sordaria macrospora]|uniref:WGS project CABT00000000 data, contig 2.8 n=2 Tax=Sordaria macrospora TaxID=5147 RepID=F7VUN0_SORMK|nr:uncharacterized protein SMAC_04985 [Sordaria macrospora k-hell]KAA8628557.1 hypothetical protein SMACR_04985 [Sordaria macrospora]WPJ57475.1 hypothetical protein SMAC4_04985 [Sordaria macrospora]CCC09226.1 unnamed protein product [Sordaria macrospora k-hell]
MPSTATANASKEAPKDAVLATTLNQIMPLTDKDSGSPPSEPVLTLICSSTDSISQDSDLTANISPEVPTMDAANVPLPDEECDEDLLEIPPLDDHEGNILESDAVEIANSEPTEADNTIRDQDDAQPENDNHHDASLASTCSTPSSPQTPRKHDGSQTDDDDLHGSSMTSMSSIDSSPKTPEKEESFSHPFVVEDSGPDFSLDDLDLSSPNWMANINQFLEQLGDLEPEKDTSEKEKLTPDVGVVDGAEEYDGPIIALPDTPDYHPFSNNFQVRLSKYGGFGTLATRDLMIGEVILIEKPLLRTSRDDFYNNFLKLSDEDQTTFLKLYTPPGEYSSLNGSDYSHIRAIVAANSFAINPYGNNIICVYNVASRLNHACQPVANVRFDFGYQFDMNAENADVIKMIISRKVKAGSELFISYGGSPMSLYERYGFRCCCGGCEGVSDVDLAIKKKREMMGWKY